MKIVHGPDIHTHLLTLIEQAQLQVVLICPYFQPWDRLRNTLFLANNRLRGRVLLVLRGGPDRKKQEEHASPLVQAGVTVDYLQNLHAKLYISEKTAMVTSLNMLQSSAVNSWEVGVLLDANEDSDAFGELIDVAKDLVNRAREESRVLPEPPSPPRTTRAPQRAEGPAAASPPVGQARAPTRVAAPPPKPVPTAVAAFTKLISSLGKSEAKSQNGDGHCIRCRASIALNPAKPLCPDCYRAWAKFQNPEYKEQFCHTCGLAKSTSLSKPNCRSCWEASA